MPLGCFPLFPLSLLSLLLFISFRLLQEYQRAFLALDDLCDVSCSPEDLLEVPDLVATLRKVMLRIIDAPVLEKGLLKLC